jgi:anti-anti-sigma factor
MGRISSLEIRAEVQGRLRTVHLSGELDVGQANRLLDAVKRLSAPGAEVVVDLAKLTFIDSSGLGSLLSAYTAATRRGARLVATHLPPQVTRVVEVTGLRGQPPFAQAGREPRD